MKGLLSLDVTVVQSLSLNMSDTQEMDVVKLKCFIFPFIIWLCLTKTGDYQIHEFDWLKSILSGIEFPI